MMHQSIAILQEQHEEQLLLHHPQHLPAAKQQLQEQQSCIKSAPMHYDPQQQQQQQQQESESPHTSGGSTERSLSQRLWRFVRENVLTQPRRKVRSASYSPEGSTAAEMRPRDNKRRARSCGQAPVQPRIRDSSGMDSSAARASATITNAWRKSQMLQELEATAERNYSSCTSTPATYSAPLLSHRLHHATRRRCSNCAQLFVVLPDDAASTAFCSLDCQSSFEYLATMQRIVDVRIDEDNSSDETDTAAAAWGTTL